MYDFRMSMTYYMECNFSKRQNISTLRVEGGDYVIAQDRVTADFFITIGLYQESTLNSYLFTLVLDVLMTHIQELTSRYVLFTNDVVLF